MPQKGEFRGALNGSSLLLSCCDQLSQDCGKTLFVIYFKIASRFISTLENQVDSKQMALRDRIFLDCTEHAFLETRDIFPIFGVEEAGIQAAA